MQKKLSAFPLKVIAITSMLINHIGHNFNISKTHYEFYIFSLIIGKLTFPIMAYLLTEGYRKTSNIKKYVFRLGLFWMLSIVPFWLCFNYPRQFSAYDIVNNIMFTLLLGILLIILTDRINSKFLSLVLLLVFMLMTFYSDWNIVGIIIIFGFHSIKNKTAKIVVPIAISIAIFAVLAIESAIATGYVGLDLSRYLVFLGILFSVPLLLMYNGERGYSPSWVKWGFYIFYPVHLLIIGLISL